MTDVLTPDPRQIRPVEPIAGRSLLPTIPTRTVVQRITPEREAKGIEFEQSLAQRWHRLTTPLELRGAPAMVETADGGILLARQLGARMPWMERWAETIESELRLMLATGRPWLQLPPTLLVGPPGCGKSHALRLIAKLSGCGSGALDFAGVSDNRVLEGTARGWSTAQPCWPLVVMHQTCCANPTLLIDEVDKAGGSRRNGDPVATLLAMTEPSAARNYHDGCLLAEADLSGCSWLMTANSLEPVPHPLKSRLDIVEVGQPPMAHVGVLIDALVGDLAQEWETSCHRMPGLPTSVRRQLEANYLAGGSVRFLKRQVRFALGMLIGQHASGRDA